MLPKCDRPPVYWAHNKRVSAAPPEEKEVSVVQETFVVKIHYNQNATWQGTVDWINQKKQTRSQHFRSALELIRLIDSTMEGTAPPDWEVVHG